ncbi:formylglycine-generating enzyme family protein [Candidatus Latescibacterota bacterium]
MEKNYFRLSILVFITVFIAVDGGLFAQGRKPATQIISFKNGGKLSLVTIPPGSFQMGSNDRDEDEQPVHTVTLDSFEIAETEVTRGQYEEIMGEKPFHFDGAATLPAERITWLKAAEFCNRLSIREGLDPCYDDSLQTCNFAANGFRLPTEAEWEYACRAGTSTLYNTGDDERSLSRAGWYGYDAGNSSEKPHPVAQKEPNAWGLYDMHGNVLEWTNDNFGGYSEDAQKNPTGQDSGTYKVLRGGSWFSNASHCSSTFRINDRMTRTSYFTGFRIARREK